MIYVMSYFFIYICKGNVRYVAILSGILIEMVQIGRSPKRAAAESHYLKCVHTLNLYVGMSQYISMLTYIQDITPGSSLLRLLPISSNLEG